MNKRIALIIALILVLAGGVWIARRASHDHGRAASARKDTYQCSMHPNIVSDKPGDCPICHMRLTKVAEEEPAPPTAPQKSGKKKYQCSMHPQIVSDKPGNCPICNMKLTPVVEDEAEPKSGERKVLFYRHPMNPGVTSPVPAKDEMGMDYVPVYEDEAAETEGASVDGHAPFTLSRDRQQMIGVKTTRVEKKPLNLEIRSVGRVAYDPDLYNAIAEYKEAASAREMLSEAAAPETRERVDALVKAARLRLRVMGITEENLPQMINEASDPTNLLLPGKSVWIYAQVYEYEADAVRAGQAAIVTVPASRDRAYRGRVAAVDPVLDPTTRTLRVRIKVETPQERLKPESFVHVKIQVPLGRVLAVPEDAVLDTGENQLVFVKEGQGRFEPRAVRIGREAQGEYEIISGLQEGEEIVTSANFLIDSESRFRAAVSAFSGNGASENKAATGHSH
jgi:membrane fusion protein, copper/silver efflux system